MGIVTPLAVPLAHAVGQKYGLQRRGISRFYVRKRKRGAYGGDLRRSLLADFGYDDPLFDGRGLRSHRARKHADDLCAGRLRYQYRLRLPARGLWA